MSSSAVKSQGTTLHISGTGGGAKTITAAAPGFPTIFTSSAHGLANGDSITIASVVGTMATTVNVAGLVVKNVTTNTFTVELNTVGLTYTSGGTATALSWIKVGQLTDIKGTSDSSPDIEVTDLDSTTKEYVQGLPDTGSLSATCYCVDSDSGLTAVEAAFDARTSKTFKVTYPSGSTPIRTFAGYVKAFPKIGDASKDGVVTGSIEIKRSGVVTKS
ncbi:MAG: phage tail protein [Geobacteraceae bacterium]|nr:phage tail protein [Geobacteraceae bacterium]